MKKNAFIFPGQGSQSVGMLAALAAQYPVVGETFAEASEALGFDLWRLTQDGPAEELNQTQNTQPALLAAGIATWRAWKAAGGPDPDYMAGHSLGEYTALVASGAMDFGASVSLVAERGRLMQEATPPGTGAMAAVIGLEDEVLRAVCEAAAQGQVVSCANFNSPGQVVIAGDKDAVDRACEGASEAGARRAIPLAVSVPSHCALMKPAAGRLAAKLDEIGIQDGTIPVVHNADVAVHPDAPGIRDALARQLWQPVRWAESIEWLIGQGSATFAECGPGKVLSGLNRRISREVTTFALVDPAAIEKTLEHWS